MPYGATGGRGGYQQNYNQQQAKANIGFQQAFHPGGVNPRTSTPYGTRQNQNNTSGPAQFSTPQLPPGPPGYQQNIRGPAPVAGPRPPATYVTRGRAAAAAAASAVVTGETAAEPVKMEPQTPTSTSTAPAQPVTFPSGPPQVPAQGAVSAGNPSEPDTDGEAKKPAWMKGGKIAKVSKGVKKRRMNARLRKILQPKNPIMVLTELRPGIKFAFVEQRGPINQAVFSASVEVDGKTYTGQGSSKPQAKQNASERALRAVLLERMCTAATAKMDVDGSGGSSATTDSPELPPVPEIDTDMEHSGDLGDDDGTGEQKKKSIPEDNTPWSSLASYAIYRLFCDWQNQGIELPAALMSAVPETIEMADAEGRKLPKGSVPHPMKTLPVDAKDRPPVMLLHQMHPGIQFVDIAEEGKPPNTLFTVGVSVEGKDFTGKGRNKKLAKNEAAKVALTGLYQIQY